MGFFSLEQVKSKSRPDGRTYSCASCGLYHNSESPKMEAFGNFRKGILNIGEAPKELEDQRGRPWQGKAGRLLQRMYNQLGIDLFEDCLNINAVNCRTAENGKPSDYAVACCRPKILKLIQERQPKVIVLFGDAAVTSLIGARWKKDLGGVQKWRGFNIPDREYKAWVCPVFHPDYVERAAGKDGVDIVWKSDLKKALTMLDKPLPVHKNEEDCVEIVPEQFVPAVLDKIHLAGPDLLFFDYETTGIKPHSRGHRIVCMAMATAPDKAYVFLMPKKKVDRYRIVRILKEPAIGKGAANMKFEETWSVVRLGTSVSPWVWDTMQAAHILDNRQGITSLKFQAYINLGVADYDSHIEPFLKSDDNKNANAMNKIYDLVQSSKVDELLMYCGLDALYEYQVGLVQMNQLGFQYNNDANQGWL